MKLAGIDPGSSGAITLNWPTLRHIKMPQANSGTDLLAVRELLREADMVFMEHVPAGGFSGVTRKSDNDCHSQMKELYGLMVGSDIPFHTITPKRWQKWLGLPSKKSVELSGKDWKDFLWEKSQELYPGQKITKYSADAYLLLHILESVDHNNPDTWP